jgi:hypothetical protein
MRREDPERPGVRGARVARAVCDPVRTLPKRCEYSKEFPMKRLFPNLFARFRKSRGRRPREARERRERLHLERLEDRLAPSTAFPSGPCAPHIPSGPC